MPRKVTFQKRFIAPDHISAFPPAAFLQLNQPVDKPERRPVREGRKHRLERLGHRPHPLAELRTHCKPGVTLVKRIDHSGNFRLTPSRTPNPALPLQPAEPRAIAPTKAEISRLRSLARLPLDWLAMAGGFVYWAVLGLLVTLVCGPFSWILPKAVGQRLGRKVHHLIFHCFVLYLRATGLLKDDLTALDRLGKIRHPLIAAPNHSSLWDAVFIIARMPQAICVMKKSILRNPFLGGGSRLAGYIPNGTTTRMIRDAADALGRGGQLLLFPEGTRTHPSARWINPLKGGCALIAARANVPVYPLFIRSNTRFFQKGWPLWKPPAFPIRLSIEVGDPVIPHPEESPSAFTERLQSIYEQELSRPHPLRRQIDS